MVCFFFKKKIFSQRKKKSRKHGLIFPHRSSARERLRAGPKQMDGPKQSRARRSSTAQRCWQGPLPRKPKPRKNDKFHRQLPHGNPSQSSTKEVHSVGQHSGSLKGPERPKRGQDSKHTGSSEARLALVAKKRVQTRPGSGGHACPMGAANKAQSLSSSSTSANLPGHPRQLRKEKHLDLRAISVVNASAQS